MKKSTVLSAMAALSAAALLAGCSSGSGGSNATVTDDGNLAIEVLLPIPLGLPMTPLIVAEENGYFADQGLEVEVGIADGSGYLSQQLVAGNVDFALMGAADAVISYDKRDDVRVLFCNQVNNVYRIVATEASGVTDVAGLEGKALGYTEPGGGESQLVDAAIAEAGLVANESITLLPVGPAGPQSLVALQDDTIQAYSSSFPDIAVLAADGIEWVDITPAKYSNVPGACMTTTEEVLNTEEGMTAAKALTTAWVEGQYFAIENPEAAFEIVCEAVPAACENPDAAAALFEESLNLIIPPEGQRPGELKQSSWDTVVEILSSSDTISADTDVSALISGENVEAVIAAAYANH